MSRSEQSGPIAIAFWLWVIRFGSFLTLEGLELGAILDGVFARIFGALVDAWDRPLFLTAVEEVVDGMVFCAEDTVICLGQWTPAPDILLLLSAEGVAGPGLVWLTRDWPPEVNCCPEPSTGDCIRGEDNGSDPVTGDAGCGLEWERMP
jgi:hypothetical protein